MNCFFRYGATAVVVASAILAGCNSKTATPAPAPLTPEPKVLTMPASASALDAGCAAFYSGGSIAIQNSSFSGQLGDVLVADMDGDGNADIIVASGNDVSKGDVHVLYGGFDGGVPARVWSSNAPNNYRRLAIGDVDGDGHLDIAVAVEPGTGGPNCTGSSPPRPAPPNRSPFYPKQLDCDGGTISDAGVFNYNALLADSDGGSDAVVVAVFRNLGAAGPRNFGSAPSQSFSYQLAADTSAQARANLLQNPLGAVSVDFGDYNGDGWLDLAVAGGNIVANFSVPVQALLNDGKGKLQGPPVGWSSSDQFVTDSVRFLDWNGDGLVDLLATTQFGKQWGLLFLGVGSASAAPNLSTTPVANTPSYRLNCALVGANDVLPQGAGAPLIAAAVNAKLVEATASGDPGVIVQNGDAGLPVNVSPPLTAGIRWVDIDGDGRPDLLVPVWLPNTGAAEGVSGGPVLCDGNAMGPGNLSSISAPYYFAQGIGVGDIDNASVKDGETGPFSCVGATGRRYVIPIADPNEQSVTGVQVNGQSLDGGQYASPPNDRLVYVAGGLTCSQTATLQYKLTRSPDFVVGDFSQCAAPLQIFLHN